MNQQADPENELSSDQNISPEDDEETAPLKEVQPKPPTIRVRQPSTKQASNFSDALNKFSDRVAKGLDKLILVISVEGKKLIEEINERLSQPLVEKKAKEGNIQEGSGENEIHTTDSQDTSVHVSDVKNKQDRNKELWKPPPLTNQYNLKSPGYFLDGWADMIEGMGDKVLDVRKEALKTLVDREMPSWIQTLEVNAHVGLFTIGRRQYLINKTSPGAITTMDIRKHGKDLYVSWRTFIKPVLNWALIIVILIAASGLASFFESMYVESMSLFARGFSVDRMFSIFLIIVIILTVIMLFFGRVIKGDLLAYFVIEPNLFDAEDITAMSLSAHKSILRALDSTGIEMSKLRLKQTFKGGRRGEDV